MLPDLPFVLPDPCLFFLTPEYAPFPLIELIDPLFVVLVPCWSCLTTQWLYCSLYVPCRTYLNFVSLSLIRFSGKRVGGTSLVSESHYCELDQPERAGIASFVSEPRAAVDFINSSCLRYRESPWPHCVWATFSTDTVPVRRDIVA